MAGPSKPPLRGIPLATLAVGAVLWGCAPLPRPAPPPPAGVHLRACTEEPVVVEGEPSSRGCVGTWVQELTDPVAIHLLHADRLPRRFLVYVPANLPARPAPLVLVFPGKGTGAETMAHLLVRNRFEELADRDGFVVVYGNGADRSVFPDRDTVGPHPGFLDGCFALRIGEGIDVAYVREIVRRVGAEVPLDSSRIYATGISAGGGFSLELALEAPDLVAAVAAAVPVPFQPKGRWLQHCEPKPGFREVSVAFLAGTADPHVSYAPGQSAHYRDAVYPGMEETRDAWLEGMGIEGTPTVTRYPDTARDDSYEPQSGMKSSTLEAWSYPPGPRGQEFLYLKGIGMGHWWPNPRPSPESFWPGFGKTNRDVDFADLAWEFFRRHPKPRPSRNAGGDPPSIP